MQSISPKIEQLKTLSLELQSTKFEQSTSIFQMASTFLDCYRSISTTLEAEAYSSFKAQLFPLKTKFEQYLKYYIPSSQISSQYLKSLTPRWNRLSSYISILGAFLLGFRIAHNWGYTAEDGAIPALIIINCYFPVNLLAFGIQYCYQQLLARKIAQQIKTEASKHSVAIYSTVKNLTTNSPHKKTP